MEKRSTPVEMDNAAAERARLRAALAGFEGRLSRCRQEVEEFLAKHRRDLRWPSELAFLLGQLHGIAAHCRDLGERYRLERRASAARDWPGSVDEGGS